MAQGFAALLRQNRTTRQLTQETLAELSNRTDGSSRL